MRGKEYGRWVDDHIGSAGSPHGAFYFFSNGGHMLRCSFQNYCTLSPHTHSPLSSQRLACNSSKVISFETVLPSRVLQSPPPFRILTFPIMRSAMINPLSPRFISLAS